MKFKLTLLFKFAKLLVKSLFTSIGMLIILIPFAIVSPIMKKSWFQLYANYFLWQIPSTKDNSKLYHDIINFVKHEKSRQNKS